FNNESRGKIVIGFFNINKYHLKVLKDGGKEQPLDIIFAIRLSICKTVSPEKWKQWKQTLQEFFSLCIWKATKKGQKRVWIG
ncbi:hypothetical protein QKW61_014870, partial [Staphylococcus nepalensis]|nr:hypothetical protein [Staphylococcus nepalensis]